MASISEILIGQADQAIKSTGQQTSISDAFSSGINNYGKIAQLAQQREELEQAKQAHAVKAQEVKTAKLDKFIGALEKGSSLKGSARANYYNKAMPQYRDALELTETFPNESLQFVTSSPETMARARTIIADARAGKLTEQQAIAQFNDPVALMGVPPTVDDAQDFYEELTAASKLSLEQTQTTERGDRQARATENSARIAAGKEVFDREDSLRSQLTSNPISKTTYSINESYDKIQGIVKKKKGEKSTAADDMSLVFAYMKMLDPASTVREGEQAQARDAAGVPDRILNAYNQAVSGTTLGAEQRNNFLSSAKKIYSQQQKKQDRLNTQYVDIAKRSNANPQNVLTGTEIPEDRKLVSFAGIEMTKSEAKEKLKELPGDPAKIKEFKAAQRKKLGFE